MNNEINVLTPCTGVKTGEPVTRERSNDSCQTRLLTRRVVFSICTGAGTPEDAKLIFCALFKQYFNLKKNFKNNKIKIKKN